MTNSRRIQSPTASRLSTDESAYERHTWRPGPMTLWVVAGALVVITLLAVLPVIYTTSPTALSPSNLLEPPNSDHLFGTDQLGRDVFARVLHGARISITVACLATLLALVLAGLLGAIAATGSRWLQEATMRCVDIGLAFPGILLPLVLAAAMGPSMGTTIVALGILFTFPMSRVVRAAIFNEYGFEYVTAARLIGTSRSRLVGYHIGLNAILPILVYSTLILASAILGEAALSFLGAGVPPPAPSWGNIIRDGFTIVHSGAWWVSLFPGLAIVLSVFGLNRLSESLGRRLRTR